MCLQHHEFTAPFALAALYAHPIEFVVADLIPFTAGFVLFRPHIFFVFMSAASPPTPHPTPPRPPLAPSPRRSLFATPLPISSAVPSPAAHHSSPSSPRWIIGACLGTQTHHSGYRLPWIAGCDHAARPRLRRRSFCAALPAPCDAWPSSRALRTLSARFDQQPDFHDFHHMRFNCCYGNIGWCDALHGGAAGLQARGRPWHPTLWKWPAQASGGLAAVSGRPGLLFGRAGTNKVYLDFKRKKQEERDHAQKQWEERAAEIRKLYGQRC